MAFRDTWHRALVYFGLAEDDAYEEELDPHEQPEAELQDTYRERPNVRRLTARRRRDEIDDIFADEADDDRRTTSLRPVAGGPRNGRGGGMCASTSSPRRASTTSRDVADKFKDAIPVILNLQSTDTDLAKRLIDFSSGLDVRARWRHAADRRQGLPAHAAQRRGLRRGARASCREGLLQSVLTDAPG